PAEDLHSGRYGDDHRRCGEVHLLVDAHSGREHVVCPHDETDYADRDHGVGHAEIAENRLAAEGRDDLADHAEARQDHDVHFWVPEEPEEVLIEHDVTAA